MVHLVKLSRLVPDDLYVLSIVEVGASHVVDAARDAVNVFVHEAAGKVAPALERRTDGVELIACERALEVWLAHTLEGRGLGRSDKVV